VVSATVAAGLAADSLQLSLFDLEAPVAFLPEGLWKRPSFFDVSALADDLAAITEAAPFRHMRVPGGGLMSVAMTNCGAAGWVSDAHGYRYSPVDPTTGRPWPALPLAWRVLARQAAACAGFDDFMPDVCLINLYAPGARMGLHRDSDEADLRQPIVSLSLGASAQFLWGGLRRRDPVQRVPLNAGDVLVWGGPVRLAYHGVAPLRPQAGPAERLNLTFRRALPHPVTVVQTER
jgi:alkylated DNA repair protein (DNA oxidative demethylase)